LAYGQTSTYGELALRVGHPRAARAVGTVMATNRFPILIPCHRVLASGGKLGGYSSHAGTNLKQILLDMERVG
jgi:methylated-DNA-[protein]-cysteine S-methyltransferase